MSMLNETWTLVETVETVTGLTFSRARGYFARFVKRLSAVISIGLLLSGCEGPSSSPTSPGSPTVTGAYTLSGVVTELTPAGMAPVEGARVEEARSRRFATTDANGFYSLSRLSAANTSVSVNKPGYVSNTRTVTISGDTQLDLRVERMVSYVLSGLVFEVTESGRVPIEGVELYCDGCGSPVGHTFVHTDTDGLYSFAWTLNGLNPVFVTKAGYAIADASRTLLDRGGMVNVTVNGDTRFDIQLERR
jgi:hypothetical protein